MVDRGVGYDSESKSSFCGVESSWSSVAETSGFSSWTNSGGVNAA